MYGNAVGYVVDYGVTYDIRDLGAHYRLHGPRG